MKAPNTLKIEVDLGYAFDYLSILEIKKEKGLIKESSFSSFRYDLSQQLGNDIFFNIVKSNEYIELKIANTITFDKVEQAKTDEVLASEVDNCNYSRFLKKRALQKKFCRDSITIETKTNEPSSSL